MNYKILYLIPIFIVSLAVYFAYYVYMAEGQMPAFIPLDHDYMIYRNGNYVISINGTNGNADYNSTDSGMVIQKTINAMKNGQTLFIKSGNYNLASDLIVNKSVSISGSSVGTSPAFTGSKITTNNHTIRFEGADFIDWNYIWIQGSTNNNNDIVRISSVTNFHSDYLKVTACSTCIGVHFLGNGINSNGWFNIENLYVTNAKIPLYFSNSTQGRIEYSQLSAYYENGMVFDETDNVTFGHMSISSPQSASNTGIIFGTSSTSKARGQHFDYLTVTTRTGQPGFTVNYAVPSYLPATIIDHYLGFSPQYNNNSTHNSVIYFDALSKTWKGN